jgi:hypothetical protein
MDGSDEIGVIGAGALGSACLHRLRGVALGLRRFE